MQDTIPTTSDSLDYSQCSSIPSFGNMDHDLHWFPMRVAYGHVRKACLDLDKAGIEFFYPVNERVETHAENYKVVTTPLIENMLFVRSTKEALTDIKHSDTYARYLRFITFIPHCDIRRDMTPMEKSAVSRIVTIPDNDMNIFIKFVSVNLDRVTLIPFSETFNHIGRKIRILHGPLAGTVCTLRRIKKNKHVHVDVGGLMTAQLEYLPKDMYELLN